MASSRVIDNEIAFVLRLLLSSVPSLRASAEQRADFHLLKAELLDMWAVLDPSIAAQAQAQANKARAEAHAIHMDF